MGEKRDVYVNRLKQQIDGWNDRIDRLEARTQRLKSDARVEYEERLNDLRTRRDDLRNRLKAIQDAGENAWEALKEGLEEAREELKRAFEEAESAERTGGSAPPQGSQPGPESR